MFINAIIENIKNQYYKEKELYRENEDTIKLILFIVFITYICLIFGVNIRTSRPQTCKKTREYSGVGGESLVANPTAITDIKAYEKTLKLNPDTQKLASKRYKLDKKRYKFDKKKFAADQNMQEKMMKQYMGKTNNDDDNGNTNTKKKPNSTLENMFKYLQYALGVIAIIFVAMGFILMPIILLGLLGYSSLVSGLSLMGKY